ncbi:MAG: transposase [Gaiellaceae bacterium]
MYHVMSRGNRRQPIFRDDQDRNFFLGLLETLLNRRRWRCHGYCLMPNHYHVVVETPNADLSAGMQMAQRRIRPALQLRSSHRRPPLPGTVPCRPDRERPASCRALAVLRTEPRPRRPGPSPS